MQVLVGGVAVGVNLIKCGGDHSRSLVMLKGFHHLEKLAVEKLRKLSHSREDNSVDGPVEDMEAVSRMLFVCVH